MAPVLETPPPSACNLFWGELGDTLDLEGMAVFDAIFRLKSRGCTGLALVNEKPVAGSSCDDVGRVKREIFMGPCWIDFSVAFEIRES